MSLLIPYGEVLSQANIDNAPDPDSRILGKHNLSALAADSDNRSEVCVYCHTPVGSEDSTSDPLWVRQAQSNGKTYNTFDTLGVSTQGSQGAAVGSVSFACLSCHDGVQALDTTLNQGSAGGSTSFVNNQGQQTALVSSGSGLRQSTSFNAFGGEATFDHPVGVKYAGGGYSSRQGTNAIRYDGNQKDFVVPTHDMMNEALIWWVDTKVGSNGAREKTDMQLYTRSVDGGQTIEPFVECASCHDPHTNNLTFLRMENKGNSLCWSCHNK